MPGSRRAILGSRCGRRGWGVRARGGFFFLQGDGQHGETSHPLHVACDDEAAVQVLGRVLDAFKAHGVK